MVAQPLAIMASVNSRYFLMCENGLMDMNLIVNLFKLSEFQ